MDRWVVLCEIVSFVEATFFPMDVKLSLTHAVEDPVKMHINRFGSFLFYSIVGNAGGGVVVYLYGRRWLGMAQLFEGGSDGAGLFAVVEQGG
jgi:membrane protein YqaA with SNARE-associated domain